MPTEALPTSAAPSTDPTPSHDDGTQTKPRPPATVPEPNARKPRSSVQRWIYDTPGRRALRKWCKRRGRTKAGLARSLKVSPAAVSQWLTGAARPAKHMRLAIERVTQISPTSWDDLLGCKHAAARPPQPETGAERPRAQPRGPDLLRDAKATRLTKALTELDRTVRAVTLTAGKLEKGIAVIAEAFDLIERRFYYIEVHLSRFSPPGRAPKAVLASDKQPPDAQGYIPVSYQRLLLEARSALGPDAATLAADAVYSIGLVMPLDAPPQPGDYAAAWLVGLRCNSDRVSVLDITKRFVRFAGIPKGGPLSIARLAAALFENLLLQE